MPDREKVISGLECCSSGGCYDPCCPYNDPEENNCVGCTSKLAADALALLREQDTVEHALAVLKAHGWKDGAEAVEPKPTGIEPNYNCGKCGLPIQQGYPFCPWCGRAVKWND